MRKIGLENSPLTGNIDGKRGGRKQRVTYLKILCNYISDKGLGIVMGQIMHRSTTKRKWLRTMLAHALKVNGAQKVNIIDVIANTEAITCDL